MAKMLKIDWCGEYYWYEPITNECIKEHIVVPDWEWIPHWCPLPDAPKTDS